MNATYHNALRTHGKSIITHIGLVNGSGTELSGGDPAYARVAVTWSDGADGVMLPNANLLFDIPAGGVVAGWRGFSASSGGTNYGGAAVPSESYTGQGTYTLLAADTGIIHETGS
jgi:hypothetical protein